MPENNVESYTLSRLRAGLDKFERDEGECMHCWWLSNEVHRLDGPSPELLANALIDVLSKLEETRADMDQAHAGLMSAENDVAELEASHANLRRLVVRLLQLRIEFRDSHQDDYELAAIVDDVIHRTEGSRAPLPRAYRGPRLSTYEILRAFRDGREPEPLYLDEPSREQRSSEDPGRRTPMIPQAPGFVACA